MTAQDQRGRAMRAAIGMWGHSPALRLPKKLADGVGMTAGVEVEISVEDGRIIVAPARPTYRLDELLARYKPEHRHEEADWGAARGQEAW